MRMTKNPDAHPMVNKIYKYYGALHLFVKAQSAAIV